MASKNLVIIGSSTGGPEALTRLFAEMPPLDAVIILVQHMPAFINESMAAGLRRTSKMDARVIKEGEVFEKGVLYLAPSGRHLVFGAAGDARFSDEEKVNFVRPSIDVVMESVRPKTYEKVVGVILTGMGKDGARGLKYLKESGALTLAQDEASSVVFGMPRAAIELGGVDTGLSLERIAARLLNFVGSFKPA